MGKARFILDLASLSLLAIVVVGVLTAGGDGALAFQSSPIASRSPQETPPAATPSPISTYGPGAGKTTHEDPGLVWLRSVGIAIAAIGAVLVLAGLVYWMRPMVSGNKSSGVER